MTYRVLIAEDSATIQRVLEIAFAGEDAELHVAPGGAEALDAAAELRPDVILVDTGLAGGGGYAFCEQVRKDARLARTALVLLTSAQHPFDGHRASEVGVTGKLQKPFASHQLVAEVRRVLSSPPQLAGPPPPAPTAPERFFGQPAAASPLLAALPPQRPTVVVAADNVEERGEPAPLPVRTPKLALPPLPNWDRPPQPIGAGPSAPDSVAAAVAQALARMAPNLDKDALNARIADVVEREVVNILWEVVPRLAENQLLAAHARGGGEKAAD